jgi:hypothetical protein
MGRPAQSLAAEPSRWERLPAAALGLAALLLACALFPRVQANPRLVGAVSGVAAFLFAWALALWAAARRSGQGFRIECAPLLKSHYIQASVQICVYLYWGWYWPNVYAEAPLFLAQLVFLYAFDALLSWTRGRSWRVGCGPLPIILSTNVFIWFRDDWYVWQFALVATAALGKEFIKWQREGKRTHIFNPSAFGLGVVSLILIATGTTQYTWGPEIASTIGKPPHIYLEIFLLGLVVQYFFSVTLMTLSAAAVLCFLDLAYTRITGTYFFVDTSLPIAIFLGLHLLVTDPSTSPRTNLGRAIFGGLYGLANFVLYWMLESYGIPEYYDKLLPVLGLNLGVQAIDRFARSGIAGRFTRWEALFAPRKLNLAHMGCWAVLFAWMLGSGFVEGPHPGASVDFWKQAYVEGKPAAGQKLLKLIGSQADAGSAQARNELGVLYIEGRLVPQDHGAAAHYFSLAAAAGDRDACANVVTQFLFLREARSDQDVAHALAVLEALAQKGTDGRACSLVGLAYETGRGRPLDAARAAQFYRVAGGPAMLAWQGALPRARP